MLQLPHIKHTKSVTTKSNSYNNILNVILQSAKNAPSKCYPKTMLININAAPNM